MLATSERSFSSGTQADELSASVHLRNGLAALYSKRKIEFNSVQNVERRSRHAECHHARLPQTCP